MLFNEIFSSHQIRLILFNRNMLLDIALFIVSIVIIIGAANLLTDGAAGLARRLGISPLVVGLTVVAFGTSAPELVVSLSSALKGSADIALGNAIGSNIFNNLAVIGITAMITPLSIKSSTIKKEIPLLILASCVLSLMVLDNIFGFGQTSQSLSRSEGLVLLAFFAIFLVYSLSIAKEETIPTLENKAEDTKEEKATKQERPIYWLILFIVIGLAGLVWGGDLFVSSSVSLATKLGVREGIIGLTLVALGTSLPELATAIVAALKKEPELAMGNIVGSGIFNIFCILGITASVCPFTITDIGIIDLAILVLSALTLYIFGVFFGNKVINRWEGAMLFLLFISYNTYLFTTL